MRYAIYPPIGIARVGDSPDRFFVGPEIPGRPGVEINSSGCEAPIAEYKHSNGAQLLVKRQGARFRIFEFPDDGSAPRPVSLPDGAVIEWKAHLVNKKAAVVRSSPPSQPNRPVLAANPAPLLIDPGSRTIQGANAASVKLDGGRYRNREVPLGELRTDAEQRLIVLGGHGFSSSPTNVLITNFYNNPGWHDDIADGSVSARVLGGDGSVLIGNIEPAWVIVGPPDFAPDIEGMVTLYDVIFAAAGGAPPARPSFTRDVYPLLKRARDLRWVNEAGPWTSVSDDWPVLSDNSPARRPQREAGRTAVRNCANFLTRHRLTNVQLDILTKWAAGDFESDWTGEPAPSSTATPDGLTRAALDGTVGQGFFPGIEAGIILRDATLYSSPFEFRIKAAGTVGAPQPGDLSALMALPWQADFWDCVGAWWPSQRPDSALTNPNSSGRQEWARGIDSYDEMVRKFARLGFVVAAKNNADETVFVESQRAPEAEFNAQAALAMADAKSVKANEAARHESPEF